MNTLIKTYTQKIEQVTEITFVSNITGKFFEKTYSHVDEMQLIEFVQKTCNALDAVAVVNDTVIEAA